MDSSSSPQPSESTSLAPRPTFSKEQEAAIFQAACRRVTAAVCRQQADSTRGLLGPVADTPVYGAFVTLKRGGRLRSCCGHIELPVPLFKALDSAADRAATDDPRFPPIASAELSQLDVDVWILWAPELVQARGMDRVNAITIGKHGVQIASGGARGLLLPGVAVEHRFDALTFLQQVCIKAGLPTDAWLYDDTQLRIFEGDAIHGPMQPEWPEVRPPAVAGGFYPGDPAEVQRMVDKLFAAAAPGAVEEMGTGPQPTQSVPGDSLSGEVPVPISSAWSGALVPHAGWIYSGALAAAVFARLKIPEQVIILCPRHRPQGAQWAVAPHRRWLFPGGELASDPELATRLAAGIEGLELDAAAHQQEHAIEVQLPLLAHVAPQTRVVGIVVGDSSLPELLRFGVAMSVVLRDMPRRPLLIVSSDMNHFANDQQTRQVDRLVLDAIATLDPEHVYETVRRNRISMCGMAPCVAAMEALRWLNCLKRCESVGYTTSAESSGDTSRVVGYAGLLFG
jgi:AmmeMemoRadiSam system protein B/AmmeMemoRadiSam system protein A